MYEVKTLMALSCTQDGKKFWGFNAELITTWQEILPAAAIVKLKQYDHQCLNIAEKTYEEGLVNQFSNLLKAIEAESQVSAISAWLKIEPDRLLQIRSI